MFDPAIHRNVSIDRKGEQLSSRLYLEPSQKGIYKPIKIVMLVFSGFLNLPRLRFLSGETKIVGILNRRFKHMVPYQQL